MKNLLLLALIFVSTHSFAQSQQENAQTQAQSGGRNWASCMEMIKNFTIKTDGLTAAKCSVILKSNYGLEEVQQQQLNGADETEWWTANTHLCTEMNMAYLEAKMTRSFCSSQAAKK